MKKAILMVSFGTSHSDTRNKTIEPIYQKIKMKFKNYLVEQAYTSHFIIKKIKAQENIYINTTSQALENFREKGIKQVFIQPLHIIPGFEYNYLCRAAQYYKSFFEKVIIGRPLLFYKSINNNLPDDFSILIDALKNKLNDFPFTILMGHGSSHHSNSLYSCFEMVLRDKNINNVFVANVEGYPTLNRIINLLKQNSIKKVKIMTFMLVAGEHVKKDMAGEQNDSWKNILKNIGVEVELDTQGLGEIDAIQNIYLQHLNDAINEKY